MSGISGRTIREQTESGFVERSEAAQASTEITLTAQGKVSFAVKDYEMSTQVATTKAIAEFERLYTHFIGPCPWLAKESSLQERLEASLEQERKGAEDFDVINAADMHTEGLGPKGKIHL